MKRSSIAHVLLGAMLGCSGAPDAPQPIAIQSGVQSAGSESRVVTTGAGNHAPVSRDPSPETVRLVPGFTPDPTTVNGMSGGVVDAATFDRSCNGFISEAPDHFLAVDVEFAELAVLARSPGDITLVVQMPDETFRCNDDHEGTNPLVRGRFPGGTYRIWIGSYERGTIHPYALGFTELSTIAPSNLSSP